jgi:hypothetical protein
MCVILSICSVAVPLTSPTACRPSTTRQQQKLRRKKVQLDAGRGIVKNNLTGHDWNNPFSNPRNPYFPPRVSRY